MTDTHEIDALPGVRVGDRVRTSAEGTVLAVGWNGFSIDVGGGRSVFVPDAPAVSVEKLAPPVEHFGPGDVVRCIVGTYALASEGYTVLEQGRYVRYALGTPLAYFNTGNGFTRVTLGPTSADA